MGNKIYLKIKNKIIIKKNKNGIAWNQVKFQNFTNLVKF